MPASSASGWQQPYDAVALYIHWPFCKAKCPYCDFNSHVRQGVDAQAWQTALLQELAYWQQLMPHRQLTSIFFGGGTPSLMPPETVAALVQQASQGWQAVADLEITLEANPTSVEAARMKDFKAAGVNRVSMGIQALVDADLQFLGREHSVAEALHAFETVASIMPRTSFDLIYARPGQSLQAWEQELHQALGYARGHVSAYQLTIEPQTPFYTRHERGDFALPKDELAAELYHLTGDMLAEHAVFGYEISNYAAPGLECRHNLAYWQAGDWAGVGPGAHARWTSSGTRRASVNHKRPESWLEQVQRLGHGMAEQHEETAQEHAWEHLVMGLRLADGVDVKRFYDRTGLHWQDVVDRDGYCQLEEQGVIQLSQNRLVVAAEARPLLNHVLYGLL